MNATAVIGGAGFIGAHAVELLLGSSDTTRVVVYDNFTSGREWHLEAVRTDPRLEIVVGDVKDLDRLVGAVSGVDRVIHLASNPDIAAAVNDPTIDFYEGTLLTNNVIEAMRRADVRRILYASGSGVYGDLGELAAFEDYGPMIPTSTYGASKLAGEALLSAYAYMFDIKASAFRFGNVVGPRQTHGVGFDFVRRLLDDPTRLRILGDGSQSKSYIHVTDVLAAVMTVDRTQSAMYVPYNVATGDYITVTEIAELACEVVGLDPAGVEFEYTGGNRGWKGDVPIVRLDTDRILNTGWTCAHTSREALRRSLVALVEDARAGRFG